MMIELIITLCAGPFFVPSVGCHVLHLQTKAESVAACRVAGRQAAAVVVGTMPGFHVARLTCKNNGTAT